MSEVVLDASAVLVLLQGEPGAEVVLSALPGALMCTVNHSEVVAKLSEYGMPDSEIREALSLPVRLVDFDATLAFRAGLLRSTTRALGLSLGDRACIALALEHQRPVLTADGAWSRVPDGPEVRLLRPDPSESPATGAGGRRTRVPRRPR